MASKSESKSEAPADTEQPGTYKDNPDKPDPSSVAQVQVLPDEKG